MFSTVVECITHRDNVMNLHVNTRWVPTWVFTGFASMHL